MLEKFANKAQLFRQLVTAHQAGLTFEQAFNKDVLPPAYANQVDAMHRGIQQGRSVANVLSAAGIISAWEKQLIDIGEQTGTLVDVLNDFAGFNESKYAHARRVIGKLVAPASIYAVAVIVLPLPRVYSGNLESGAYLWSVVWKLGLALLLFNQLVLKPLTHARLPIYNPWLLRILKYAKDYSNLRLIYDITYLRLLSLCLRGGMDAAASLKLLANGCPLKKVRRDQLSAASGIAEGRSSLTQALLGKRVLTHPEVLSFLASSEQSGTLHSGFYDYVSRRQQDVNATIDYWLRLIPAALYSLAVVFAVLSIL